MKMGFKEVLSNLTNFDCWDFKHYSLRQEEAEMCIIALEKCLDNKKAIYSCPYCNTPVRDTYKYCPECGELQIRITEDSELGGVISAETD